MNQYNKLQVAFAKLKKENATALEELNFYRPWEEYCKKIFAGRIDVRRPPATKKRTERVVNLLLSDLHIGADVRKEETGHLEFGRIEEARRLAAIVDQAATFKSQYRKETTLRLMILGDVIQNMLHDPRDGAPLAEQMARATHLLIQAIIYLAGVFKLVEIELNPGNHGRNTARHFERATNQKWDAIETMVYVAVKYACANLPHVKFNIPRTPFVTFNNLGHEFFATHGDTVLKPGNPGSSIAVKALEFQTNRMNAALIDRKEFKAFIVGHVHVPSITFLPNGAVMITNGALIPVDQFAVSIGMLESQCGQWIWESTADHPVGDQRLIRVGREHDKDKSLEKIIKPWRQL